MDPITRHHYSNIANGSAYANEDGSLSTVYTTVLGDGEREYLIPKVWDGEILSDDEAWERAMASGIEWPSAPSTSEGVSTLEQFDERIHERFSDSTTPDEAMDILTKGFSAGGIALSDATKGIRTKEGIDMAKNKFQLDRSKADENGDGEVSEMEKISGEAAQRTVGKDNLPRMAHGGLMCGDTEEELPLGANPENVADDIPAMLSQDEYVLPAHVVKWHGLKHIQEMQAEAEAGLMAMSMTGLIGGEEPEEENEPKEGSEEDVAEDLAEGEALDDDDMIESENVVVGSPTVMVEDELEDESYEEEPSSSALPGMMKKQKYAFIVS